MTRIAYLGPEGTFTEAALSGMVAARTGPADRLRAVPGGQPVGSAADGSRPRRPTTPACRSRTRSRVRCYRRSTASRTALWSRSSPSSRSISRSPSQCDRAPPSLRRSPRIRWLVAQVARWAAKNLPEARFQAADSNAAAAVDVAEGRADAAVTTPLAAQRYRLEALAADVIDEQNARTRFVLAGLRQAAAPAHRRRPHIGGAAPRQRSRRAGVGVDGVLGPQHRPHPDRIAAHPNGVGYIHLFCGLCRPRRR